ncbi:DUF3347 domain-containing protein [Muricauda sp. 334s03]|uniref:DUF3347 domain-containing protein n=1 Tax=Flagellimonas yonaguniensis TaxID=3031325 RepID=A0ABT5XZI2_9FLAO|nr:DUF3347 domain-containing protein [[Muricauda] yonaguniensis]MDF0716598.1 DUF3347 domain-containing protein [[Muricauda] yonaguniensis]
MRKSNVTTGILAMAIITLLATSCKDKKKVQENQEGHQTEQMEDSGHMDGAMEDHSQMDHDNMNHGEMAMMSSEVIADYLTLKNALVSDDKDGAAKAGEKLEGSLKNLDTSKFSDEQQDELKDIIEDATEHAEHIAKSDIGHQREHFDVLSKDVIDLLAITGSDRTLYQAYCPMYNNNKGAQWLSATKEIKNPYYGAKMMSCGSVQKEIN